MIFQELMKKLAKGLMISKTIENLNHHQTMEKEANKLLKNNLEKKLAKKYKICLI
jgi:hypothetical protein